MSGTREENVFMARLAEQADRHEDMVEYMKRVALMGTELSLDERNLLSVAYKHSVGARRQAWRSVNMVVSRDGMSPNAVETIKPYHQKIEKELNETCDDVLNLLQEHLIPKASDSEAKVFYLKMKGDYYRYFAEFASGDQRTKCAQEAHDSYQSAMEIAGKLPSSHPIRLGLALNFSVFYYEVFGSPDKACALAKSSFEEAVSAASDLGEADYQDSAQILGLLHDNLQLWTANKQAGDDKPPEQDGTNVEDL